MLSHIASNMHYQNNIDCICYNYRANKIVIFTRKELFIYSQQVELSPCRYQISLKASCITDDIYQVHTTIRASHLEKKANIHS